MSPPSPLAQILPPLKSPSVLFHITSVVPSPFCLDDQVCSKLYTVICRLVRQPLTIGISISDGIDPLRTHLVTQRLVLFPGAIVLESRKHKRYIREVRNAFVRLRLPSFSSCVVVVPWKRVEAVDISW
jgi:hypothetical protein